MPDGEKLKKIYDAVSTKYDLGSYDEFAQKLQDPTRRKKLYDAVSQDFDLGDYTTFNQKLGFDSKEVQQQSAKDIWNVGISKPEESKTVSKPLIDDNHDYTKFADSVLDANKNKNFVQRYLNPDNYPKVKTNTLKGHENEPDEQYSTHLMADDPKSKRVYPTIVQLPNGKLKQLSPDEAYDYADKTGEYIQFKTAEEAAKFADNGYKRGHQNIKNNHTDNPFLNAQKPTGTISNEQVLQGQQQAEAAKNKTIEQTQVAQYGGEVQKAKDEKVNQAALNTVSKKQKSSSFPNVPTETQVNDLLKAYDNGDLAVTQDAAGNDVLKRTGNFFESFKAAADETYTHQLESNYLVSLPKDQAIQYLNQKREHPEVFTKESDIAPTGISKMLGEQSQILGKGIIGGLAGTALAPETGGASFATFLAMAKDLATGGYSEALTKNYDILKQQQPELSDSEIYDRAHQAALTGEVVSLATGAILSAQLPKPKIDVSGALQMFKSAPKVVGSAAAGSVANDIQTNLISAGQGVTWEQIKDNAEKSAEPMALMHFGLGSMAALVNGAKSSVPSYARPQFENVVASADRKEVENYLSTGEQQGVFPHGTTQKVLDKLNEFDVQKEVVKNMPISEEKKAAITGKLIQRKDLVEQTNTLKGYGSAFEDKVTENEKQISAIDKDINKIYSSDDFLQHEKDAITGEPASDQIKPQEDVLQQETKEPSEITPEERISGTTTVAENKTSTSSNTKEEIETEFENIDAAIEGAKLDDNKEFEGKSLDELLEERQLLKDNPERYFGKQVGDFYDYVIDKNVQGQDRHNVEVLFNQYRKIFNDLRGITNENLDAAANDLFDKDYNKLNFKEQYEAWSEADARKDLLPESTSTVNEPTGEQTVEGQQTKESVGEVVQPKQEEIIPETQPEKNPEFEPKLKTIEDNRQKEIHELSKPKLPELDLLGKEKGSLKEAKEVTANKISEKVKDKTKAKELYRKHENIRRALETLKAISECV